MHSSVHTPFIHFIGALQGDQSVTLLHPDVSYNFFTEIFKKARDEWGMTMLFKDDLQDQASRLKTLFPITFGIKVRKEAECMRRAHAITLLARIVGYGRCRGDVFT